MNVFAAAASFAAKAHRGQMRMGAGEPYINHPLDVAATVACFDADPTVLAAAVLHDVVEDCDVSLDEISRHFGPAVAALVDELTDDPAWNALPMAQRKSLQAQKFESASPSAKRIKIADQWCNVGDLAREDTGWSAQRLKTYGAAAVRIVDACADASPQMADHFHAAHEILAVKIAEDGL